MIKSLVLKLEDLPSEDNQAGDIRLVLFLKQEYIWSGSSWELHKDLSDVVTKTLLKPLT